MNAGHMLLYEESRLQVPVCDLGCQNLLFFFDVSEEAACKAGIRL
jgi:hypothetical protein